MSRKDFFGFFDYECSEIRDRCAAMGLVKDPGAHSDVSQVLETCVEHGERKQMTLLR